MYHQKGGGWGTSGNEGGKRAFRDPKLCRGEWVTRESGDQEEIVRTIWRRMLWMQRHARARDDGEGDGLSGGGRWVMPADGPCDGVS